MRSGTFNGALTIMATTSVAMPMLLILLTVLLMPAATAAKNTIPADPPLVSADGPPSYVYPQRREIEGYMLLIHAPQIRGWPQFKHFEAQAAVELASPDGSAPRC